MKVLLFISLACILNAKLSFAQTYSDLIEDKDFETLLMFDLIHATPEDARVIGVEEQNYSYAAFTIGWESVGYAYRPDRDTEIEARFRDILHDSVFAATYERDIEKRFSELKKPMKLSFISDRPDIRWTHKTKRGEPAIYYTMPIVTSDKKYVIFAKKFQRNNGKCPMADDSVLKRYERRNGEWWAIPVETSTLLE